MMKRTAMSSKPSTVSRHRKLKGSTVLGDLLVDEPLDDVIKQLIVLQETHAGNFDLITLEDERDWEGDVSVKVVGFNYETEEEYAARLQRIERVERKQLADLKAKYGA